MTDTPARIIDSPVGPLHLTATRGGLTGIRFSVSRRKDGAISDEPAAARVLQETERQLAEYFAGTRREFDLPLAAAGTEFQLAAWQALQAIPYGRTISYGELARRIGRPRAVRAVGAANGANPIPIVIPCHRVIGADGRLTGFGGGLPVKRRLLELEGASYVEQPDLFTRRG